MTRKRSRTLLIAAAAAALLAGSAPRGAWAMGGGPEPAPALQNPAAWSEAADAAAAAGVEPRRAGAVLAQLEAAGYEPATGTALLQPALEAARGGLPAEWVLDKIGEGALKGVPAAELRAAAEHRAALLQQAAQLSENAAGKRPDGRGLLLSTAMALESGVGEDVLRTVYRHAAGTSRSGEQLQSVVEAGESFHLAGLDADSVQTLMMDCLDRNLTRLETTRVVRYVRDQAGRGLAGAQLRTSLWSDEHAVQQTGGPGPAQRRGPAGGSTGGGPGGGTAPGPGGNAPGGGGPGSGPGGRH